MLGHSDLIAVCVCATQIRTAACRLLVSKRRPVGRVGAAAATAGGEEQGGQAEQGETRDDGSVISGEALHECRVGA